MGNFASQEELSGEVITCPQKQIMLANSACEDSIPTIKKILSETREVTNWYSLGIQLEITPEDLNQIGSNYSGDAERCKAEVVNFWLRNTQECTWGRLAQAVDEMGGHTNLVQTLRKNHQGNPNAVKAPVYNSCVARYTEGESLGSESVSQQSSYSHRSQPKSLQNKSGWTEGSSGYGSASPSTVDSESEDTSSYPTTPVGCGCGKCSLYTLCSKGCSKPSGGTPLPIWNGTECTYPANSWQYSYESKLIDDTKEMSFKFASLVNHTVDSLKRVSLNRIVLWMKHLEAIKSVTKAMPLLGERMEEISKAENVEQLFWILSDYWSWYNKDLLEKLVNEFGDREDQDRLREYNKEYTAFFKKRLPKSHDHFSFGAGHGKGQKPLLIKVDEIWEAISLGQIRGLHHNIAEILGVPPHMLYLSSVSKGCICLDFMVPSLMPDHLFPLTASQEKALMAANASRLECGEYIWQAPNCSETLDSEADVSGEGLSSDKGYDGSSESEGQSDGDHPGHAGNKSRKKRKAQGRRASGSSKLHFTKGVNLGHLKNHWLTSIIPVVVLATFIFLIASGDLTSIRNGTITTSNKSTTLNKTPPHQTAAKYKIDITVFEVPKLILPDGRLAERVSGGVSYQNNTVHHHWSIHQIHSSTFLLFGNQRFIATLDLDGSCDNLQDTYCDTAANVVGIDFDYRNSYVFWSDEMQQSLRMSNFNGFGIRITRPSNVAWGWINKEHYWTDYAEQEIEVYDFTNVYGRVLLYTGNTSTPIGIVVDPQNQWFYWVDASTSNPKIKRVSMDETSRTMLHNTGLTFPSGITLDYASQTLYWIGAARFRIEGSDADGTNHQTVTRVNANINSWGIVYYSGNLYWTDRNSNRSLTYTSSTRFPSPRNQLQSLYTVQQPQPQQVAFVISQDLDGSYFCSLNNMSSNTLDLVAWPQANNTIPFQCLHSATMLGRLSQYYDIITRIYNFHAASNPHFLHHNLSLTIENVQIDKSTSYRCMVNIDDPRTARPTFVIPLAVRREQVAFVISQDLEGTYFCSLNNMSSNTLDLVVRSVISPAVQRENQGCANFTCKTRGTPLAWSINERNVTHFDDGRFKGNWITIGCHENTFPVFSPQFCVRRQDLAMPNQLQSLLTVQQPQPQQVVFVIRQDLEGSYYIWLSILGAAGLKVLILSPHNPKDNFGALTPDVLQQHAEQADLSLLMEYVLQETDEQVGIIARFADCLEARGVAVTAVHQLRDGADQHIKDSICFLRRPMCTCIFFNLGLQCP